MAGPSITYTGTGREPLRSDPDTLAAAAPKSSGNGGKPAGGTENTRANFHVLSAKAAKMVKGGANRMPSAVQTFKDGVSK